jgi:hypothetical protein
MDANGDGLPDAIYTVRSIGDGSSELFIIEGESGPPAAAPSVPTDLAASTSGPLELTWNGGGSAWAREGHVGYGVLIESDHAAPLVIGALNSATGTASRSSDPGGLHAGLARVGTLSPGSYTFRVAAFDPTGRSSGYSEPAPFVVNPVGSEDEHAPGAPALLAPRPNPATGYTMVKLIMDRDRDELELGVYDVLGRLVVTLHRGAIPAGTYEYRLAGLAAGLYAVRARSIDFTSTRFVTFRR